MCSVKLLSWLDRMEGSWDGGWFSRMSMLHSIPFCLSIHYKISGMGGLKMGVLSAVYKG